MQTDIITHLAYNSLIYLANSITCRPIDPIQMDLVMTYRTFTLVSMDTSTLSSPPPAYWTPGINKSHERYTTLQ